MHRRPLNISAALAIAIERQVEDIIANAKVQCALQYRKAPRRGLPDPPMSGFVAFAPPADLEDGEADRLRQFDDAIWPAPEFTGSVDSFAGPRSGQRLDIWKRLRSLLKPRPFRA